MLVRYLLFSATVFLLGKCTSDNENNEINLDVSSKNLGKKYKPDWSDLDTRPLPEWYDRAKIGIFVHWGVYCVPGYGSEWFWDHWNRGSERILKFMAENYPPGFTYQEFAPMFKAEFFNASGFAELFARAGAQYVVLTTKHHEGYTLYPSKRSFSWNSVDVGPHRDLVGELAKAIKKRGLKFGAYHSLYEWFNPIYLEDRKANFTTRTFTETKLWPDLEQLVNDYEPAVIWSDGDWETDDSYWKSTELLAWLYNDSPVKDDIVVNDRWGIGTYCKHGDFYNCLDNYNPGILQNHKWENAFSLDLGSWGYRRNMGFGSVMTMKQGPEPLTLTRVFKGLIKKRGFPVPAMKTLLKEIITTISCGGNALINVGPTKEGMIAPIFVERLLELGQWLKVNGEGIYGSSPWLSQNDTLNQNVWYTCKKEGYNAVRPIAKPTEADTVTAIYAYFLVWPESDNVLTMADITEHLLNGDWQVSMLGHNKPLHWDITKSRITKVHLPIPGFSNNAWALKFTPKQ